MGYDPIEDVELKDVTENELRAKGVMSLATRPNAPSRYGEGGLTAEALKAKFDGLARALADRINNIHNYLRANNLADKIKVDINAEGESGIPTLAALAEAIESGDAAKYFTVRVGAEGYTSLQEAIFNILEGVSNNAEAVGKSVARFSLSFESGREQNAIRITAYNKDGNLLTMPEGTDTVYIPNAEYWVYDHNQSAYAHPDLRQKIEQLMAEDEKDERVNILEKKVENLRATLSPEYFTTDPAVEYIKQVPADALPFAEVQEVGGMSYAVCNLFNAGHVENQFGGTKENIVVENGGAKITITGDPDGSYNSVNLKFEAGVTYCATWGGTGKLYYVPAPAALTEIKSGVPFTPPTQAYYDINCLAFGADGGTYTDLMIVRGDKPAKYMPYGQNTMKNAAVTSLDVVGANILDMTPALNACLKDNGDGTYTLTKTANGRFSESFPLYIPKGQQVFCYLEIVSTNIDGLTRISLQLFGADKNDNGASIGIVNGGAAYAPTADTFFANAYLQDNDAVGAYVTFRNPMIKYGKSAEFSPYSKHTYPVPAEVKALEGWGLGVNETYHNRLDWTKKQYRQEVGTVDMGDLTYSMRVSNGRNIFGTSSLYQTIRGFVSGDAPLPAVATGYRAVRVADTWVDGDMAYGSNAEGYTSIEFVNNAYTDAASFKEAMRGRKLIYALAKPIVTDLTNLSDDNFIEVEGGGTVTAVNEHELAAPTKIEYQLKEATA